MKNPLRYIGLLGGTFDPIHNGHLHIAREVLQKTQLAEIQFLPLQKPPHRAPPMASADDRLTMLKLALQNEPAFRINPIELQCEGPSYTINTLRALSNPHTVFYFIMGMDCFVHFHTWKDWQAILTYAHIIIVNRPDYPMELPPELQTFYTQHHRHPFDLIPVDSHGALFSLTIEPCPISATRIRHELAKKPQNNSLPLPEAVGRYIAIKSLYRKTR